MKEIKAPNTNRKASFVLWMIVGQLWVCIEADSIPGSLAGLVVFRRYQREIVTWLRLCHNVQLRMEKQSMQMSCVTDNCACLSMFIMFALCLILKLN